MDANDCDALVAAVLAECDSPASRRLVLDAWAASDRPAALRALLGWVRGYAAAERERALRGGFCEPAHKPGELRGVKARPDSVACWWFGVRETATRATPVMGYAAAGERLPPAAVLWSVEGQGYWWRLPAGGLTCKSAGSATAATSGGGRTR